MDTDRIVDLTRRQRAAHVRLVALGSKTYQAMLAMEASTFAEGALTVRHKELIAVGIAVATGCESGVQRHIEHAVEAGAGGREVLEAIEVGLEMGGDRATDSARFALEVMNSVFPGGI